MPDAQHRLAELAPRITTVQEAEIDLDWNYLVDGWFLGGEASIVYAPSNLGKSTFVIDLASAIVSGKDWHGYAGRVVRSATELAKLTGCHVLLVHHTGKDKSSGPRGASNLVGTADAAVELVAVEKDGAKLVRAIQTKQRRLAKSETITFKIIPMLLGRTSEGKARTVSAIAPITSGEIVQPEPASQPSRAQQNPRRSGRDGRGRRAGPRAAGFTPCDVADASFDRLGSATSQGVKVASWKTAVRRVLAELAADPSLLVMREGGRYGRPVPFATSTP